MTQNSEPPNQKKRHKKAKEQASLEEKAFFEAPLEDYLAPSSEGMDVKQLIHFKTLDEIVEWLDEDGSFNSPFG